MSYITSHVLIQVKYNLTLLKHSLISTIILIRFLIITHYYLNFIFLDF